MNDAPYRGPLRREADPLLQELIKRMDRHEDNQQDRHEQNSEKLDAIRKEVSTVSQAVGMNTYRLEQIEEWKRDEAEPAIDDVRSFKWMARGAVGIGGIGGVAGIVAWIKAFIIGGISHP